MSEILGFLRYLLAQFLHTILCRVLRALAHNTHLIFGVKLAGKSIVPILRSNFRASVPWCINTCKSEFSAENADEKQADLARGYDLFRAELTL